VWTYALELARALAAAGVRVDLATMGAPLSDAQREEAADVPGLAVFPSALRLEWMEEPWEDVRRAGEWLLGLERELRPDVVHLNGYAHGALDWSAPVVVVAHSCVLSWWSAVRGGRAPSAWDGYAEAVGRGLAGADALVAPTQAMLDAIVRHYGPQPRARVIPNARRAGLFAPAAKEPFVLSAGRLWDEAKNLAALDRVAACLPWPVYVAGDDSGPMGGRVSVRAVRPLGRLAPPALADQLGRAAIYALPARYEPFGLSVLEAALAGCALVLGDIPSLREVWGDSAAWVDPEDTDGLRAALEGLIRDPRARADAGARARERARAFTPARMASAYLEVYDAMRAEVTACAS
jgi:glycogen(starch) synthase